MSGHMCSTCSRAYRSREGFWLKTANTNGSGKGNGYKSAGGSAGRSDGRGYTTSRWERGCETGGGQAQVRSLHPSAYACLEI